MHRATTVSNARVKRLVGVGLLMIGLIILMYVSVDPETQYTVDEVLESPEKFADDELHLRGVVKSGSLDNSSHTFILEGVRSELLVSFSEISVPDGFQEGKTIAVKGILSESESMWELSANEIQTGCPSKYES